MRLLFGVSVSAEVRLRPGAARAVAENLRAVENFSFGARTSGRVFRPEITTEEAETAAQKARRAVSGPLVLTASRKTWQMSPDEVGSSLTVVREVGTLGVGLDRDSLRRRMSGVYADLTLRPVEAGYYVGGRARPTISVTPGHEGRRLEEDKLFDAKRRGVFSRAGADTPLPRWPKSRSSPPPRN